MTERRIHGHRNRLTFVVLTHTRAVDDEGIVQLRVLEKKRAAQGFLNDFPALPTKRKTPVKFSTLVYNSTIPYSQQGFLL